MSKLKQLFTTGFLATTLLLTTQSVEAYCPTSYLDVAGGWRSDEIRKHVFVTTTSTPPITYDIESRSKNLDIWEVGLDGRLVISGDWLNNMGCCDSGWLNSWWLNQLFIDGSAYWGWVTHGDIRNTILETTVVTTIPASRIDKVKEDGHTYDYSVGAGWLYPVTCEFAIGPTAGYAWNRIIYKTKSFDIHSKTKWTSPWLGFEADYQWGCEWFFQAGYQYHWTRESGSSSTPGIGKLHSNRDNKHGTGHEAFVDGWWSYDECWEIGLGFKYRYFKTKDATVSGSLVDLTSTAIPLRFLPVAGPEKVTWQSYEVTLKLAYNF